MPTALGLRLLEGKDLQTDRLTAKLIFEAKKADGDYDSMDSDAAGDQNSAARREKTIRTFQPLGEEMEAQWGYNQQTKFILCWHRGSIHRCWYARGV